MNPFETETMADLCLRQGHRDEALAIYRRLLARAADDTARHRLNRRITFIEQDGSGGAPAGGREPGRHDRAASDDPLPIPGVRARWSGDDLTVEWRLPAGTDTPGLEVLLVKQGHGGVVTETRAIAIDGPVGRITLTVGGLHLARAAAGFRRGGRFVPVARA